jgi:hypothetical protein
MENTTHRDASQKVEGDGENPKRKEKKLKEGLDSKTSQFLKVLVFIW